MIPVVGTVVQRRTSILFILTDDQPQVGLGCMGNRRIRTPNMDALAAEGVLFTNATERRYWPPLAPEP